MKVMRTKGLTHHHFQELWKVLMQMMVKSYTFWKEVKARCGKDLWFMACYHDAYVFKTICAKTWLWVRAKFLIHFNMLAIPSSVNSKIYGGLDFQIDTRNWRQNVLISGEVIAWHVCHSTFSPCEYFTFSFQMHI